MVPMTQEQKQQIIDSLNNAEEQGDIVGMTNEEIILDLLCYDVLAETFPEEEVALVVEAWSKGKSIV